MVVEEPQARLELLHREEILFHFFRVLGIGLESLLLVLRLEDLLDHLDRAAPRQALVDVVLELPARLDLVEGLRGPSKRLGAKIGEDLARAKIEVRCLRSALSRALLPFLC